MKRFSATQVGLKPWVAFRLEDQRVFFVCVEALKDLFVFSRAREISELEFYQGARKPAGKGWYEARLVTSEDGAFDFLEIETEEGRTETRYISATAQTLLKRELGNKKFWFTLYLK